MWTDDKKGDVINTNLRIVLLEGEYSADDFYAQGWGKLPQNITGIRLPYEIGNEIIVEECKHTGYYDKYPESSKDLAEDEFNYRIARDTVLHEIGHFVDEESGYKKSDTQEFINIFYNEVENFINTSEYSIDNYGIRTNISTPLEYFATSFSCFISYPNELKKYCPMTYGYYSRIMQDYIERYNTIGLIR